MKKFTKLFTLLTIIILLIVGFQTNAQKFVHITDLHVNSSDFSFMGEYDLDGRNFSKMITQIIAENPDFVLATGDIVHTAMLENFLPDYTNWEALTNKLILVDNTYYLKNQSTGANSGIPIYFMPGNHDFRTCLQTTSYLSTDAYDLYIRRPTTMPAGYTVVLGTGTASKDYYFYNNNMVVICLNSGKDVINPFETEGKYLNPETDGLTDDQITLIENACSGVNANKVQIVAMHAPAINPRNQDNCGTDYTGTEEFNGDGILSAQDGAIFNNRTEFFYACQNNTIDFILSGHLHQNVVLDYLGNQHLENYVGTGLYYTKYVQTAEAFNGAYRVINVTSNTAYTISTPKRAPNLFPAATILTPTFETYITPAQNYYTKIKTALSDGIIQLKLYVDDILVGSVNNPASDAVIPFSIPEGTTSSILKIEATNSVGTTTTTQPLTILRGGNSFFGNLYLGSQVIITDPQTNNNYKFLFQDIQSTTPRKVYIKVYNSSNTLIDEMILEEDAALKVENINIFVMPTNIFIGSGGEVFTEIVIAPYVNPELEILSPTSGSLNDAIVTVSTSYSGKNVPWNSSGTPNVNTSTFKTLNYNGTSTTEETYFWDMTGTAGSRTLTVTLTDILGNTVTESATVNYNPSLTFYKYYKMKSWINMLSGNGSIDASSGCWDASEQEYSIAYTVQEIGTTYEFRHASSPKGTENIFLDYQGIVDALDNASGATGALKVLTSDYSDLSNKLASNCGLPGPIYKYEVVNYIKELVGNNRVLLVENENQTTSLSFPSLDGTIPTLSLSSPVNNQFYNIVENNPLNVIDVTGTAADNIHVRRVEMSINDGAWFTIWSGWALNVSWNYQINTSLLFDYNNKISVRSVDTQGNLSSTSTVTGINIIKTNGISSDFESLTTALGTWSVSGHEGAEGSTGDNGSYSIEIYPYHRMIGSFGLKIFAQAGSSYSDGASWCEVKSPVINKPVYKIRIYNYSTGNKILSNISKAYFVISDGTNSTEKIVTSAEEVNGYLENANYNGYYTDLNGYTHYYYDFEIPSNWNKNNITIKLGSYSSGRYNSYYGNITGYWDVIIVEDGMPSASISAYPTSGNAPLNVSFAAIANDIDGSIQSYSWNFGDGSTSTVKNPTHIYNSIGTKTATLTVTDNNGFTASNNIIINVANSIPVATIDNITPNPATQGATISFSGTGTDANGTVSAYEWSSSINGVFSTLRNPNYSGLSIGTHTISFRVKDNNSAWSNPVTGYLIIATLPTITTTSVSSITQTTASSGGNVTAAGSSSVTARGVCWSTSANPTIANSKTSNGTGTGSFSSSITGLTAGTTYYVRAYATNSSGTAYGPQVTFSTTTSGTLPTITTTSVTSITQTTATSGGNVTAAGSSSVTARGVCWSTSANPTIANSKTSNGTGTGSFTSSITGLVAGTTYYVRAYATNSLGTSYGSQISFTTTSASVGTVIGYWNLDESIGTTANDNSGNVNNGSITGASHVAGKINMGLETGTSKYVTVPLSTSINSITNAITISAWVKTTTTNQAVILERWLYGTGVNQRAYCLEISGGKVYFGISKDGTSTNSKWLISTITINDGNWKHLAGTFDGTTMRLYINGVQNTSVSAGFTTIYVPTGNLHIGSWEYNSGVIGYPFIGVIDELRLYKTALSASEITALCTNTPNLVADWEFNENAGSIATDNSGNINTGTLTNSPTWTTGKIGSALNFTNNYVNVPLSTSINSITNAITISTWVKTTTTSQAVILERWLYGTGVNQRAYCLEILGGKVYFGISKDGTSTNSKWLISTITINDGNWKHLAGTFDGTTMRLYINGVQNTSVSAGFTTINVPTGNLHIGKWEYNSGVFGYPFIGIIDEIKLHSKALTLSEIQSLYGLTKSVLENEDVETETEITYNCYPNPFSSDLNISYTVTDDSDVLIEIYDFTGKIIRKVVDENQTEGNYNVIWNSDESLTNGIYYCRIVVNGNSTTSKIILLK